MLYYHIKTGEIECIDLNAGEKISWGFGYCGTGIGRNNPAMCSVKNVGPIPVGFHEIGMPYHHPKEGVLTMNLTPQPATNTFGRGAFHIHGNNSRNDASHGCIILDEPIREQIAVSGEKYLTVLED